MSSGALQNVHSIRLCHSFSVHWKFTDVLVTILVFFKNKHLSAAHSDVAKDAFWPCVTIIVVTYLMNELGNAVQHSINQRIRLLLS